MSLHTHLHNLCRQSFNSHKMINYMPHIWTPTCIFQIIRECKDILAKAVLVKQYYQHMIAAVLDDNELAAENSPMDLENFDDDMSKMFKVQYKALSRH